MGKPGPSLWVILAALLLVTLLAFRGVAVNGFINYDDQDYVVANPVVGQGLTGPGIVWAFRTTRSTNWHPLTWLSHLLDVELFGMNPGAHHLVSLALHVANVVLLFLALLRLTGALWKSALVAVLFAVHPLHVESVAWAAERKDVLSTLFALAALLAYLRAARRGRVPGSIATPVFFLMAILAKPMPVSLPFLLLLIDWWPLGRSSRLFPPARLWLEKAPLFLLAAASAAITLIVQQQGGAMGFGSSLPFARRAVNVVLAYTFYLRKTVWPVDLAVFYPYPVGMPAWWLWCGDLAVLAGITAFFLRGARRRPHLAVAWFWFLGMLVPVIGLIQVGSQAWADRYTYLPLTGIFLVVVWGLDEFAAAQIRLRRAVSVAGCVAVVALAGLTRLQVARWHDSVTLWRYTLAATGGGDWVVWNLLGNAFVEKGELDQAVAAYRTARGFAEEKEPGSQTVTFNFAAALHAQGKTREAAMVYQDLLRRHPGDRDALNNLGNIVLAEGKREEAVALYRLAIASDSKFAAGHFNLGKALAAEGDLDGAVRHLREALALDPRDAEATILLADLISRRSDGAKSP